MVILLFYLDVVSRVKRPDAKTQHRLGKTLEARLVCFLQLVGHLQKIRKGSGLGSFLPLGPYSFQCFEARFDSCLNSCPSEERNFDMVEFRLEGESLSVLLLAPIPEEFWMPIFSRRSSLRLDLVAVQSHSPVQSGVSSTNFHDCGSEVRGVLVHGWPQLCLAMVLREGRWVTNYVHKRGAKVSWWSRPGE